MGVDVGSVRVGLARSDAAGFLATPLETVQVVEGSNTHYDRISRLVTELAVCEVIVGLPRSLSGNEGAAAALARAYSVEVARRVAPVPVRLVDERLSTVTAHQRLREAGVKGRKRRPVVDQAAAVVILQSALDAERSSGRPPGSPVVLESDPDGPGPGHGEALT
ncbi:Holliday junction resolvase RuvX [Kineosporia succinea]|uniref:Putative pre-16S rRNA nuclease n=1 Tax=Kineosporia succinea TaxID=84632 RepID=A0ABT9NV63_9ACTN|nr:Holliday junction resolvase RuvX [Kineosporia succinea]MDP9824320.1 putative Holliday junction resolvase [Kineosporia succinea]